MFAIPNQSIEQWEAAIREAARLGDSWMLRHGTMPLIVSDKGDAAVEKSYSTKVIVFGVLTLLSAAAGCAGLYLLVS